MAAAKDAEAAVAHGERLGPLHGVPFTVKDSLDLSGTLAMRGSRLFAGTVSEVDATAVTQFKNAGTIPPARPTTP